MLTYFRYSLFFSILAIFILWKLLLPGYVLTLDMVFTPHLTAGISDAGYYNFYPVALLLSGVNTILPAWIIQKIILFLLFFCLGFFSFVFFPKSLQGTPRLFAALFYTVNPFVYSRFLAGHWTLLLAYGLLPVLFHFLTSFLESPTCKKSLMLFGSLWLISVFSLHFFVIGSLLCLIWISLSWREIFSSTVRDQFFKYTALGVGIFLLISSYWIVPLFFRTDAFEKRFTLPQFQAFAPSPHGSVSTSLNLLSLHGFWGESQGWGRQFVWLQDLSFFGGLMGVFSSLVLFGMYWGLKKKETQKLTFFLILSGSIAFIFSTGLGTTVWYQFNLWMFTHIPWWGGFRDSQKFIGLLAFTYALLAGMGVEVCLHFLKNTSAWVIDIFRLGIFVEILLFGMFMWGGFRGQLQSVEYPSSWYQVQKTLGEDVGDYHVLFLPWHGYLSFQFNNHLLLANPVKRFFGSHSISSKSIELAGLYDQEIDVNYKKLDKSVTGKNNSSPAQIFDELQSQNIKYVVFFQDLVSRDPFAYSFLQDPRFKLIVSNPEVKVFLLQASPSNGS